MNRSLFDHGQDVAGRVLEPRNLRAPSTEHALRVRLEVGLVVELEAHASSGELAHRSFDVVHGKVEDCERRRNMVGLRVTTIRMPPAMCSSSSPCASETSSPSVWP